ncbi:MAG: hypothetical protein LZF86_60026 [Nitrospira sp.]|nr:MAG: hypothetical protein LZF86_60026 [Nitrospira sp.]
MGMAKKRPGVDTQLRYGNTFCDNKWSSVKVAFTFSKHPSVIVSGEASCSIPSILGQ